MDALTGSHSLARIKQVGGCVDLRRSPMPSAPVVKKIDTLRQKEKVMQHELELDENGVIKVTEEFTKNVAALRAKFGDDLAAKEAELLPSQHPWL